MTARLPALAAAAALLALLPGCGGDWTDVSRSELTDAAPPASADPLWLRPVRGGDVAPAGGYVRPPDARPTGDRRRVDDTDCDRPVGVAPEIRCALGPALAVGGVAAATAGSEEALVAFSQQADLDERGDTAAIVVDGRVVLAPPRFSQPPADGSLQVAGDHTEGQAQRLAAALRAGG